MTWAELHRKRYEKRFVYRYRDEAERLRPASEPIGVGVLVYHKVSERLRYVSGIRGDVVHFAQCIKLASGETFYWCSVQDLVVIG